MKVAFIGLGAMGFPMAGHLTKEHQVLVWNRTHSVAEEHARKHGSTAASTLLDGADADVVLTILPTSMEVDEVVHALAPKLRRGTLWIDATSGDPAASTETAARLAALGIEFVDAPVTGGTPGAEKGTLTVMVGGSENSFRRAEPILRPFAAKIFHCGPVGTGHAIKVVTNTMNAVNIWVAGEALLTLRSLGMDMKLALEVINAGSGRSNASENLVPRRVVEKQWPLTFKLALHDKDIRIANSIVHSRRLFAPVFGLVGQLFTAARHELGEQADYMEVLKFAASLSGQPEW
jgi:3-hydroxyisobutyrate dehydrogenase